MNTAYALGMQALLSAGINLAGDTITACLIPSGYTFSQSHQYASQLGTLIGTSQTLAGKSVAGGVFDANDLAFGTIATGNTIKAVGLFKNTGNPSTSPLIAYLDQGAGLPVATSGGEFELPWNDDIIKILTLDAPFVPLGAQKVLSGAINFLTDDIKVRIMPSTFAYGGEEFLNALPAGIGTDQSLAGKSITGGVFDADDVEFGAIAGGSTMGSLILYKSTGVGSTSPVLLHFDDVTGFPKATNGSAFKQKWSNGPAKIFKLTA